MRRASLRTCPKELRVTRGHHRSPTHTKGTSRVGSKDVTHQFSGGIVLAPWGQVSLQTHTSSGLVCQWRNGNLGPGLHSWTRIETRHCALNKKQTPRLVLASQALPSLVLAKEENCGSKTDLVTASPKILTQQTIHSAKRGAVRYLQHVTFQPVG